MTSRESKHPGDFWTKILSAAKVKRVLVKRGFEPEAFRRDYEADTSRGSRGFTRPSKAELDAVEAFQKNGDFEALKQALDAASAAAANSVLRRVVQFQARVGAKTGSRRPNEE